MYNIIHVAGMDAELEKFFWGVTFCFQLNDHELVPDLLYIYPLVCDVTIQ